jgi:hypothetical protein
VLEQRCFDRMDRIHRMTSHPVNPVHPVHAIFFYMLLQEHKRKAMTATTDDCN